MRQAASHKVGGYRRLAGRESRIRIIGPAKEGPIKSIRCENPIAQDLIALRKAVERKAALDRFRRPSVTRRQA
jgi:hypothetical protein